MNPLSAASLRPADARPQVLVVDDDTQITELLCEYLGRFKLQAHAAGDAAAMRAQLARHPIDLVVMDLMLPGTDGLALVQELRAAQRRLPVIMLTARGSACDRVIGLEMGVDDYMAKPFEPRELVARIHSVLRRCQVRSELEAAPADVVHFDGWALHRSERRLTSPSGGEVALSDAEFRLLNTFLSTPRRLLSRDELMTGARGREHDAFARSIDLLVSRLRHKLSDRPRHDEVSDDALIKTVRGAGYIFNARSVSAGAASSGWGRAA
ncbi:MAG: hypothetical protein RJA98_1915 [Pseudomonadota bacterium]|jgi:two-component system OmpR family response regulator